MTIDRLGRPEPTEIVSKKAGKRSRKMREVFTTTGYAMLDDGVKLSTTNGLASLEELSRRLLAGEKLLVESLDGDVAARGLRDADILASPGSLQIDKASLLRMLTEAQAAFHRDNEATIPRVCFSCAPALVSLLRTKVPSLYCDIDNKVYPCEILIRTGDRRDTQLLSITDFFEDETTIVEISKEYKAMVVDGLICS